MTCEEKWPWGTQHGALWGGRGASTLPGTMGTPQGDQQTSAGTLSPPPTKSLGGSWVTARTGGSLGTPARDPVQGPMPQLGATHKAQLSAIPASQSSASPGAWLGTTHVPHSVPLHHLSWVTSMCPSLVSPQGPGSVPLVCPRLVSLQGPDLVSPTCPSSVSPQGPSLLPPWCPISMSPQHPALVLPAWPSFVPPQGRALAPHTFPSSVPPQCPSSVSPHGATRAPQPAVAPVAGPAAHRDGGLARELPVLEEQRLRHPLLRHDLRKPGRARGGDSTGGCPRGGGHGLTCPTVHSMPPRKSSSSCVPTPACPWLSYTSNRSFCTSSK